MFEIKTNYQQVWSFMTFLEMLVVRSTWPRDMTTVSSDDQCKCASQLHYNVHKPAQWLNYGLLNKFIIPWFNSEGTFRTLPHHLVIIITYTHPISSYSTHKHHA